MEARTQVKPGVLPTKPIRKGNDLGNFTSSRGSQSGQSVYSSGAVSIGKGDPQSQYVLPEQAAEIRDLKALIDNLRRELERKDSRNDKLSKDMVSLRTALANQEREMRILNNTLEKVTAERSKLSHEFHRTKEHSEKIEEQLRRANDVESWEKLIRDTKDTADFYQGEVEKMKSFVQLREENVTNLEKEVQILRRALNIQKSYEAEFGSIINNNGTIASNASVKEIIKALYYDLGRSQTESHNLAITLAEKHKEIENMIDELNNLRKYKQDIGPQIEQLLNHVDDLTEQLDMRDRIVEALQGEADKYKNTSELYENQIENLTKRLSDIETNNEQTLKEKEKVIEDLQAVLPKAQREAVIAQGRADILQQAIVHHENQSKLTQQRLEVEWSKLAIERSQHQDTIRQNESLTAQLEHVRQHLANTLLSRDGLAKENELIKEDLSVRKQQFEREFNDLRTRFNVLESSLQDTKNHQLQIQSERDEALDALQQTMQAVKDLSAKYQEAKASNDSLQNRTVEAEKSMEAMKRAKEHISTAVLDALHKERSKTAALEKIIQEMPLDRRYYSTLDAVSSPIKVPAKSEADDSQKSSPSQSEGGETNNEAAVKTEADAAAEKRQEELSKLRQSLRQLDEKASAEFPWLSRNEL